MKGIEICTDIVHAVMGRPSLVQWKQGHVVVDDTSTLRNSFRENFAIRSCVVVLLARCDSGGL
jgi:hypothetical protein